MRAPTRYRVEDGKKCIDVRLKNAKQLFDLRDPAPFRERDLDPGAAEHLLTCMREIPRRFPVRIVLVLAQPMSEARLDESVLREAIGAHFEHERNLVDRAIRENFRHGRHLFVLGLLILGVFLTLANLSDRLADVGYVKDVLREGLTITGWVAMWRPAEVLLYDWWPLYEKRGWIDKLLASEVLVRIASADAPPQREDGELSAAG